MSGASRVRQKFDKMTSARVPEVAFYASAMIKTSGIISVTIYTARLKRYALNFIHIIYIYYQLKSSFQSCSMASLKAQRILSVTFFGRVYIPNYLLLRVKAYGSRAEGSNIMNEFLIPILKTAPRGILSTH